MKKIALPILSLLMIGCFAANAQDLNRTDSQGRRQGKWVDYYANGQIRYDGQFKNNNCQGEFKYYDEQGNLKATNTYDKTGEKALNKTYAPNGTLIATGYYVNQKKNGEWRYYSRENGVLILVEENRNGKAHGSSKVYYETGVLMMERQFVDDKLEGPARIYYHSGALKDEGNYLQGEKTGIWKAYNEDGDEISSENYSRPD